MSAPVPPPTADDPATGWQVCVVATGAPVATFSHRDKAQADADRLNAVARKVWFDVRPVSTPPADDERIPPLTAQQLGLCGPLSDDPGVGPDAARHTPPADDDARADQPAERRSRAAAERRWNTAVDALLNSRFCAEPDVQTPFWSYVDGEITEAELRRAFQ